MNDVYPDNKGMFFYIGTRAENKWWRYYVDNDDNTDMETSDGLSLNEQVDLLKTDNKFITYNRTKEGVRAWMKDRRDEVQSIKMQKKFNTENYFIIMHRGKGGYTARTIKELQQETGADYDILADLYRNALAFQVKEDGSVGYKFMVKDCESETGYKIEQEWSYPDMVKTDEWATITVRFVPWVFEASNKYGYDSSMDYMTLMFYVNGRLVLNSKPMPTLALRMLSDEATKQEGVPYNISLGGGTQGLSDTIYENYKDVPEYILFLEKEFGGSFNGFFKSFKFYVCDKNYSEINGNIKYESELLLG